MLTPDVKSWTVGDVFTKPPVSGNNWPQTTTLDLLSIGKRSIFAALYLHWNNS